MRSFRYLLRPVHAALIVAFVGAACGVTEPGSQGTVRGSVRIEGAPAAVRVTLRGGELSREMAATGEFSFSNVPVGTYVVEISDVPAGSTFPTMARAAEVIVSGDVVTVDFDGSWVRTSSIIGNVSISGPAPTPRLAAPARVGPVEGIEVALSGDETRTTATDGSGQFVFGGLRAGSYNVAVNPGPSGYEFPDGGTQSATLGVGDVQVLNFVGTEPSDPILGRSPASLIFNAVAGGADPAPRTVQISNVGTGTLDWTATDDQGWISLVSPSGSSTGEADNLTVNIDITGLAPGTYNGTVTITGTGAAGSPQTTAVTLIVAPLTGPALVRTPAEMVFNAVLGEPNPPGQVLQISNGGPGTMPWGVTDDRPWISPDPPSGTSTGEIDEVTVSVDITGLTVGQYTGSVTIAGTGAVNSPQTVSITLNLSLPTITITDMQDDVPITISDFIDTERFFRIPVPAGAHQLQVRTFNQLGFPDLFVRRSDLPTTTEYDCREPATGADLFCTIDNPEQGDWFVMVKGPVGGGVDLVAHVLADGDFADLQSGVALPSQTAPEDRPKHYRVVVTVGTGTLRVTTSGGVGTVSIYAREGAPVVFEGTEIISDVQDTGPGTAREIEVTNPGAGIWWIALNGESAYNAVTIQATNETP